MIVGASLRGRPCFDYTRGASTEGRPYDLEISDTDFMEKSIQETYAPRLACFGCGPANDKGLHVRSFPEGDQVIAEWQPQPEHEAFTGMLSGGIIETVHDCHCNWEAAWH